MELGQFINGKNTVALHCTLHTINNINSKWKKALHFLFKNNNTARRKFKWIFICSYVQKALLSIKIKEETIKEKIISLTKDWNISEDQKISQTKLRRKNKLKRKRASGGWGWRTGEDTWESPCTELSWQWARQAWQSGPPSRAAL